MKFQTYLVTATTHHATISGLAFEYCAWFAVCIIAAGAVLHATRPRP